MKKGFTLIELLAVILILGIISLIAIPTINKILEESRRGAVKDSTLNYVKAIESTIMTKSIALNTNYDGNYTINNNTLINDVSSFDINIKGDKVDDTEINFINIKDNIVTC